MSLIIVNDDSSFNIPDMLFQVLPEVFVDIGDAPRLPTLQIKFLSLDLFPETVCVGLIWKVSSLQRNSVSFIIHPCFLSSQIVLYISQIFLLARIQQWLIKRKYCIITMTQKKTSHKPFIQKIINRWHFLTVCPKVSHTHTWTGLHY